MIAKAAGSDTLALHRRMTPTLTSAFFCLQGFAPDWAAPPEAIDAIRPVRLGLPG
jgi:hypothetical protein